MRKIPALLLAFVLAVSFVSPRGVAQAVEYSAPAWKVLAPAPSKLDPALAARLGTLRAGETVTVIVTLRQQADLRGADTGERGSRLRGVIQSLVSTANATQPRITRLLNTRRSQNLVQDFTPLWIINGFIVTADSPVINELARDPDVLSITPDAAEIVPAYGAPEPNLSAVNAPALWNMGITGQGVVVASMDSGVDITHPDLAARWRGGSNSWYDPYGQHPLTPVDLTGHGTWTAGVMVGGDAGGTSIGAAPGAKWIAVKIFNDAGTATASAIHLGFQWLLDPDGNPATDDAPQVVNNSWTYGSPGCNLDFEMDLQALRAAGILPVFAAGNGGPYTGSSYSPANNPSAFAVGAVNNTGTIYGLSSRGPSACAGSGPVYPDVVAPGVSINTSDLNGGYTLQSGTSLAAPHVSGMLALLLSAYPNLSAADQETALTTSALDLGAAGPDNTYGYGQPDALAAFNWLASAPTSTPVPTATMTATPPPATSTPTATSTATALPPTATATPGKTLHIGDLDRSAAKSGGKWNASVVILVHNGSEKALPGTTVTGKWTNGATGSVICVTGTNGTCTVTKTGLAGTVTSVTFTVTGASLSGYTYAALANHDPDGESTGTVIVVSRP